MARNNESSSDEDVVMQNKSGESTVNQRRSEGKARKCRIASDLQRRYKFSSSSSDNEE